MTRQPEPAFFQQLVSAELTTVVAGVTIKKIVLLVGCAVHIPDGYLGPQTYVASYAIMAPVWAYASKVLSRTLRSRQVPLLALGAAFCFVIMMFNIPIIGGTTGHAVGAVLVAVLLGPWAACIAVTTALLVQAVLFGDGGITTFAANCINMAVVMPFVGYWVYRLIAGSSCNSPRRTWIAAAVAGYAGLSVASITTAIMFGIQPIIAQDSMGRALYAPYSLKVAITAMGAEHLLVFGFVEAVVTGLAVAFLQKSDLPLLQSGLCIPRGESSRV